MSIQMYPMSENIRARFKSCAQPDDNGKIKIFFITASAISDETGNISFMTFEDSVARGLAALVVKVEAKQFHLIKHLLLPGQDLALSIISIPWALDKSNKGISTKITEIRPYKEFLIEMENYNLVSSS